MLAFAVRTVVSAAGNPTWRALDEAGGQRTASRARHAAAREWVNGLTGCDAPRPVGRCTAWTEAAGVGLAGGLCRFGRRD